MTTPTTCDVLIAGAGPVGLFLACELRLRGCSVIVLEKNPSSASPLKSGWMGSRGLNVPSTEAFYRRGLLRDLQATAIGWTGGERVGMQFKSAENAPTPAPRFAGHFAGIMLDASKIDFSHNQWMIPGPSVGGGMISLEALEDLLAEHAVKLGVDLRFNHEVTAFTETADTLTVTAAGQTFQTSWLVGCDGGRSSVRRLAGFEFAGTEPELTGYMAIVEFDNLDNLAPGFHLTPNGMYIHGPGPGRVGVVDFDGGSFDRTSQVTLENLQALLQRVSGTGVTLKSITSSTTYTDRARQATTYRRGRVLLAGDAAHVHSPFGGQGMNTGFGDAMNLGWKLAATLQGWAPDGLLDTYNAERHPIGEWVLNWTRAQIAIIRPDPFARAIAQVIRDLIATNDGTTYFAEKVSGITLHYDLGDSHPLLGRSAPDFELADGTRLGHHLHDGRGLLLDFTANPALHSLTSGLDNRLHYLATTAADQKNLTALLIRPDGFVAWATDTTPPDLSSAAAAIHRWFGAAS